MKSHNTCLVLVTLLHQVFGHGFMYHPSPWNSVQQRNPNKGLKGLRFYNNYDVPGNACDPENSDRCSTTALNDLTGPANPNDWFTNFTFVQEKTLPNNMFDPNVKRKKTHPWASPGSAVTFGEGCGVNGGNPNGCQGEVSAYGTCCGRRCGGYVGGRSALEQASEGLFDNAPTTIWQRGQVAEVYWNSVARHRGGYSYRLCQAPNGDISQVTEQCFKDGHLDFVGNKVWVSQAPGTTRRRLAWTEKEAKRTRIGTNPPGSQWTQVPLDTPVSYRHRPNWSFKDLVQVPQDINPGIYVLSFRWDCQQTPQVWNSCATIRIK